MVKTIFKEICIILLITVAVGLVLSLIFYQYLPSNKSIPSKVTAYSTPEEVAREIEDDGDGELEPVNTVYAITDADLSLYRSEKSYNPGKVDPFAESTDVAVGSETPQPSGGQTSNPPADPSTTDNYYTASGVGSGTK